MSAAIAALIAAMTDALGDDAPEDMQPIAEAVRQHLLAHGFDVTELKDMIR